jgi:lipopolysaccharide/colanic/teichoic acid biosynthesis glycosyltransferase
VKKKVEYDLKYIEQRSFLKDLRIMARTVPVMIGKKGSI